MEAVDSVVIYAIVDGCLMVGCVAKAPRHSDQERNGLRRDSCPARELALVQTQSDKVRDLLD